MCSKFPRWIWEKFFTYIYLFDNNRNKTEICIFLFGAPTANANHPEGNQQIYASDTLTWCESFFYSVHVMCYTKRTTSPYFNTWDHHHQANSLGIEFHYQLDQFAIGVYNRSKMQFASPRWWFRARNSVKDAMQEQTKLYIITELLEWCTHLNHALSKYTS